MRYALFILSSPFIVINCDVLLQCSGFVEKCFIIYTGQMIICCCYRFEENVFMLTVFEKLLYRVFIAKKCLILSLILKNCHCQRCWLYLTLTWIAILFCRKCWNVFIASCIGNCNIFTFIMYLKNLNRLNHRNENKEIKYNKGRSNQKSNVS